MTVPLEWNNSFTRSIIRNVAGVFQCKLTSSATRPDMLICVNLNLEARFPVGRGDGCGCRDGGFGSRCGGGGGGGSGGGRCNCMSLN
ncbi:Hypothetical predicted protein [Octopus vulgaris]|uniref:Uncharacterized protein n=1 Tax=Octopus vulgaris TaxID=6645 RepID=A0AA36BJB1_OCTVU|nr:Hypothetical predicted protein [Octopus vulgaris]